MAVDKSGERVRDMFAEISPNYDRMNHLLSGNVDRYWRWRTVRALPIQPPGPILDVCTGTGDLAIALYRHYGGESPVTGADFCRPMLDLAEQKKRRLRLDGPLQFVEADAQQLPFPDNQFQLVTVAFGLRNVTDTMRGLREMWRVCRPGGKVGILEFSLPTFPPLRHLYGFYFRHILPRIGQCFARNGQSAYQYLPESVHEFPAGRDLTRLMEECGWRQTGYRALTGGIATLYTGVK
ncbi:MAG: bifunctional demethylmenaquinone methyltransferase/2-methoxy-6-polyprenyl-1,4-benzoquinol methylase UbiE [Pirellulales bacterium]